MLGRIGETALMRRVAEALGIEGVTRAPNVMATDRVQPVIDVGRFIDPQPVGLLLGTSTLIGNSEIVEIYGVNTVTYTTHSTLGEPTKQSQFLSLGVRLVNAIDVVATEIDFYIWYERVTPFYVAQLRAASMSAIGASKIFQFALNGATFKDGPQDGVYSCNWNGYLPPETRLNVQAVRRDGSNWPANSLIDVQWLASNWEVGTMRPF